jgi:hypothetical protein
VDSCAVCDEFTLKIGAADDEDAATSPRFQERAHLLEADRGANPYTHTHTHGERERHAHTDTHTHTHAHLHTYRLCDEET